MSKTITISDRAYEELAKRKRSPKDSFTKVILRMTGEKISVRDVAGGWSHLPEDIGEQIVDLSRRMFDAWDEPVDVE
jgi:predicted CopG family antitoxin